MFYKFLKCWIVGNDYGNFGNFFGVNFFVNIFLVFIFCGVGWYFFNWELGMLFILGRVL